MSWFFSLFAARHLWDWYLLDRQPVLGPRKRPPAHRLAIETLEMRCLMSATLVKDLLTTPGSANPTQLTQVGQYEFFVADDGIHGQQLWKTDGTTASTKMVKDISSPKGRAVDIQALTNVNGTLFFMDSTNAALWKSDGTAAGTVLVENRVRVTPEVSPPPIAFNGRLFFFSSSHQLWASDGTDAGTVPVGPSGLDTIGNLTVANGKVFFTSQVYSGSGAGTLWASDGTAGAVIVKTFDPQSEGNSLNGLTNFNGNLYFSTYVLSDRSISLWKSDGTTAGTVLVKGHLYIQSHSLTPVNNTLFFSADGDSGGVALWKTDGTTAGTVIVKTTSEASTVEFLTNVQGTLYFKGDFGGGIQLWKSDGTEAGTVLIKDIDQGRLGGSDPANLTDVNGTLYFTADDGLHGRELWKSDGTDAGTVLVKDINPGSGDGIDLNWQTPLAHLNGTVIVAATDGMHGMQLWKSDGTDAGTGLVKDIYAGNESSDPQNLVAFNGSLFFTLQSAPNQLWESDGTDAGTTLVHVFAGRRPSIDALTVVNSQLFFVVQDVGTSTLYLSDGTEGGTSAITTFTGRIATQLTAGNNTLFFTVGGDLWDSDGTDTGTMLVAGFHQPGDFAPANLTNVNGTLFFSAGTAQTGRELWVSYGTPDSTLLVKDINPGSAGSDPQSLTCVNGTLYFSADDGGHGRQLWQSDGTPDGTILAALINPSGSADPTNLVASNGFVYFSATTPATGRELWQYDPNAGTVTVFDIHPGTSSSNPSNLTDINGELFFSANDGMDGRELWATDGTQAGTHLVADIRAGRVGSRPENLVAFNGLLFFTANDGVHGRELWQSDGTADGTSLVQDIAPGKESAFYTFFDPHVTVVNNQLFFVANDHIHGRELWVYTQDSTSAGRDHSGHRKVSTVAIALVGKPQTSVSATTATATVPVGVPASALDDLGLMETLAISRGLGVDHDGLLSASFTRTGGAALTGIDPLSTMDSLLDEAFVGLV